MLTHSQSGTAGGGARALLGAVLGTGLLLTLVAAPEGASGWREITRVDGIVVSEHFSPGQLVPTFRGLGLVEADLATVLGVIQNVDRHSEWIQDCTEARTIAHENESVSYVYHRTNVPWPLSDRDVVLRSEVEIVEPGRLIFVRFRNAPDMGPSTTGAVRIERLEGLYRLEALGPGRTSVEYRVVIEPGGDLPGVIQQRATRRLPLETVRGLRRQSELVQGERLPVLTAQPEGVVNPSATAGVVASDVGVPMSREGMATGFAPQREVNSRSSH